MLMLTVKQKRLRMFLPLLSIKWVTVGLFDLIENYVKGQLKVANRRYVMCAVNWWINARLLHNVASGGCGGTSPGTPVLPLVKAARLYMMRRE